MHISRVVVRNFRSFEHLDVPVSAGTTCVIGENNSGKTNFLRAIRICIDANCPSRYRSLAPNDIHSSVDISQPNQVLIGLEIAGFCGKINEQALVGAWQIKEGLARLIFRFRPKLSVRQELEDVEVKPGTLTFDDYEWELVGGGDPAHDLASIDWNEDIGSSIRFSDLQSFLVVFLPALRDVENDLRQYRGSPLTRLIDAMDIDDCEQEELVDALRTANEEIAAAETIEEIAGAVDKSFKTVTGPAFSMKIGVGLAEPSFQEVLRSLRILFSDAAMENFAPSSNGLGLNNILYVSILIEYFQTRVDAKKSAGQIILFEEPEAHLHPHLQLTLFNSLSALPFQSILTTHSTHITGNAPLESYVVLSKTGEPAVSSTIPSKDAGMLPQEILDLERYLDATRSSLLFARKVILVEGPAEVFLIPPLLKHILGLDLNREGISIVPIYGVHFDVYAKLFSEDAIPRKCAIIADGDLAPNDADVDLEGEDDLPPPPDLKALENTYIHTFVCKTTFERAMVLKGNVEMFARAAEEIGAPKVAQRLRIDAAKLADVNLENIDEQNVRSNLRDTVLNTAKRFGKARFAQIAARHVDQAKTVPKYVKDAVEWLSDR